MIVDEFIHLILKGAGLDHDIVALGPEVFFLKVAHPGHQVHEFIQLILLHCFLVLVLQ